jgi:hypothetical protein
MCQNVAGKQVVWIGNSHRGPGSYPAARIFIRRVGPPGSVRNIKIATVVNYLRYIVSTKSRDSSVNIATDYRIKVLGLIASTAIFSSPQRPGWFRAHSASYPVDIGALSSELKRQERKTDNSPPSNAEVNKDGAITPLHHKFS